MGGQDEDMDKRLADPDPDELLAAVVERAFREHAAQLYRYIYSKVGQAALAEDLTSEVFLKALRWLQQERSPQSIRGWLYATARTTISDDWQRRQRLPTVPLEVVQDRPSSGGARIEEAAARIQARVTHLLGLLPPRERTILTLRYVRGYTAADIGEVLGMSPSHVRVVQVRALRLAAALEANEDPDERRTAMQAHHGGLSEPVQRVLAVAQDEAVRFEHDYIGTEHVLLALMRDTDGVAARVLANLGVASERIQGGILFFMGCGPRTATPGDTPTLTPRAQRALALAHDEAHHFRDPAVYPEHVLLGLMREGDGLAAGMLQGLGVTLDQLREQTTAVRSTP
jgi:RNA polymerase sigma factor (sigma-70 family)